ncbi:MAG: hypothetical protein AAGC60_27405 [Acidobacteriota bacterium]
MTRPDELRLRRAEAAARERLVSSAAALDAADANAPGGLYLLEDAAGTESDTGIEWLWLDTLDDGRKLLVPVDGHPIAASRDLHLAPSSDAGPRIARAGHAVAVDLALDESQRVGIVSSSDLERLRALHQAPKRSVLDDETQEGEALEDEALEDEALEDPEYRQWLDEALRPAVAALRSIGDGVEVGPPVQASAAPAPAAARPRRSPSWLALAAALVVGVALGWLLPEPAPSPSATLAWFAPPDPTRTVGPREVRLAPDAEQIVLVLETLAKQSYPRYAVEIRETSETGSSGMLWRDASLRLQGASEVVVVLPRQLLVDRLVTARLVGLSADGAPTPLDEWRFRVVEAEP